MPGTSAASSMSRWAISAAVAVRSSCGTSAIESLPRCAAGLDASAPTAETTCATSGSAAMRSATRRCRSESASNEASPPTSVKPSSIPVSWTGKNPFGASIASATVHASVRTAIASVVRGWASAPSSAHA
jgi:hypothetical protein